MIIRKIILLVVYFLCFNTKKPFAQKSLIDSLTAIYNRDTISVVGKLELLNDLAYYETRDPNKALLYAEELLRLSEKLKDKNYLRKSYFAIGNVKRSTGKTDDALKWYFKSAELAIRMDNSKAEGESYTGIGDAFAVANNGELAKFYYSKAIVTFRKPKQLSYNDSTHLAAALNNAGDAYRRFRNYDSALIYLNEAKVLFEQLSDVAGKANNLGAIGMVYANIGKKELAEKFMNEAISILESSHEYSAICAFLLSIADLYKEKPDYKTAISYASKSLTLAEKYSLNEQIRDGNLSISQIYEDSGRSDEALSYYKKYITFRDKVSNIDIERSMNNQRYNYEMSQNQIQLDKLNQQNRDKQKLNLALGAILALALVTSVVLYRNYQDKQKAYQVLDVQKQETEAQKSKAEDALRALQVTQNQLIQTAKMASLGELTAGIAHEIQNPLNFVNNFSEVSIELLNEFKEMTVNKGNHSDKDETDGILRDLTTNLNKIAVHGKRADAIVKGMLQHSRTSIGNKEPTDLNDLVQEFFRLSYHGVRVNDKTFVASCTTQLDEKVGTINLIPQDIGRVLLNLFNNAFYAVRAKKLKLIENYEPVVSVTTRGLVNEVTLSIKDNGIGINKGLLDKIFQPFFTTKPTGEGTGLGLSLSYDIIHAHGGKITVDTKEGSFTEFIIHLPRSI